MDDKKEELSDVRALRLLDYQLKILQKLEPPSILEQDNEIIPSITQVLCKVKESINMVAGYVTDITEKLDEIRDIIREYDEEIADNLKVVIKKLQLEPSLIERKQDEDKISEDNERNKLAERRLKHYRNMQLLNKQNYEFKELVAKSEDVLLKCEIQVEFSMEDITNLEERLLMWSNTLEKVKERKLIRSHDESSSCVNRSDEMKEDGNSIDTNNALDHRKWPKFVYEIKGTSRFQQKICCLLKVIPGSADRTDIVCESSDSYHVLESALDFPDEQSISGIITIKPANEGQVIQFEVPILVYIPVSSYNSALTPCIKYLKGDTWVVASPVSPMKLPVASRDSVFPSEVTLIGAFIPVQDLVFLKCAAVARQARDEIIVDTKGLSYELENERNIQIFFPGGSFNETTTVYSKIVPWNVIDLNDSNEIFKAVQPCGSYLEVLCASPTNKEIDIISLRLGWFADNNTLQQLSAKQETIQRCYRWLVNNMIPFKDEDYKEKNGEDGRNITEEESMQTTRGDTLRKYLKGLILCTDEEYDGFIQRLCDSNQKTIVNVLTKIEKEISDRRFDNSINGTTNEFMNSSYVDNRITGGKLYIVIKYDDSEWKTQLCEPTSTDLMKRTLKLEEGHHSYRIICFTSKVELTSKEMESVSSLLEEVTYITKVHVVCLQNETNIRDVIIFCVKTSDLDNKLLEMRDRGYTKGPPPSNEFGVVDGEEIEIRFESNIHMLKYKTFPLKIKFFANIEPLKFTGYIDVIDTNDQRGDGTFHGRLVCKVPSGIVKSERNESIEIHIPKELEKNVDDFKHSIIDPVKILSRHIAWHLTLDNSFSTRWITFAGYLVSKNMATYRQIIKDIDQFGESESQREKCEAFILRWSSHYAEPSIDKVVRILESLTDEEKRLSAKALVEDFISDKGHLSNAGIVTVAYIIARHWKSIASKLGFDDYEISRIISSEGSLVRQAMIMLEKWRTSDSVVLTTLRAKDILCEATETFECYKEMVELRKE